MNILLVVDKEEERSASPQLPGCNLARVVGWDEADAWLMQSDAGAILLAGEGVLASLPEKEELLLGTPYWLLSDAGADYGGLGHPPLGQSPSLEGAAEAFLEATGEWNEQQPDLSAIEEMTMEDEEMKEELLEILNRQFGETIEKIPYLYEKEGWEDFIQVIHKIASKFSLLGMPVPYKFFCRVEHRLRDGLGLHPHACRRLLAYLRQGLEFIRVKQSRP